LNYVINLISQRNVSGNAKHTWKQSKGTAKERERMKKWRRSDGRKKSKEGIEGGEGMDGRKRKHGRGKKKIRAEEGKETRK